MLPFNWVISRVLYTTEDTLNTSSFDNQFSTQFPKVAPVERANFEFTENSKTWNLDEKVG